MNKFNFFYGECKKTIDRLLLRITAKLLFRITLKWFLETLQGKKIEPQKRTSSEQSLVSAKTDHITIVLQEIEIIRDVKLLQNELLRIVG